MSQILQQTMKATNQLLECKILQPTIYCGLNLWILIVSFNVYFNDTQFYTYSFNFEISEIKLQIISTKDFLVASFNRQEQIPLLININIVLPLFHKHLKNCLHLGPYCQGLLNSFYSLSNLLNFLIHDEDSFWPLFLDA